MHTLRLLTKAETEPAGIIWDARTLGQAEGLATVPLFTGIAGLTIGLTVGVLFGYLWRGRSR